MFEIGNTVNYATTGVCLIKDIVVKKFGSTSIRYYLLEPIHQKNAAVYVPVDNKNLVAKMQKLLSLEEVNELIRDIGNYSIDWIEDDAVRQENYRAIIAKGDRKELIGLIRAMYKRRAELKEKHRHLRSVDEQIFKTAENMINDEFAAVLGIKPYEVVDYIIEKVE